MSSDAALDPRTTLPEHPAKFSAPIIDLLTELLADAPGPILDPFAGTGRIHQLGRYDTVGVEIEPEWAAAHDRTLVGDATALPFRGHKFGAICTSPTYGNRMADTYAGDGTRRHTYRIALGRDLTEGSSAGLQWGPAYRDLHVAAWAEAHRVLKPGGLFVLNISDHIRNSERQHVAGWHLLALSVLGLRLEDYHRVTTRRQRHGANGNLRVDHEAVIVLRKPAQ